MTKIHFDECFSLNEAEVFPQNTMSLEWKDILKDVHPCCAKTIASLGFTKPTPVQANTIPHFTKFKDVVVEACTGSGKTLAFLIPIYHKLLSLSPTLPSYKTGALVVAPTRELSDQIAEVAKTFLKHTNRIKLALITGGIRSHEDDIKVIGCGCNIVIGTPGRILHCLSHGYLHVNELEVLVFDEADRLLEMGFEKQINSILSLIPKQRRTGLFSATQSSNVQQLIRVGLRNPIRIELKISHKKMKTQSTPKTLQNQYIKIKEGQEMLHLLYLLHNIATKQKIIVFVLTCAQVDYLRCVIPKLLSDIGHQSVDHIWYMHGRLDQKIRTSIHKQFTATTHGALICTDVVARGIDIPDIDVIIQFDPPQKIDFFVHRVGRTARMGKHGNAIVLLREHELDYLRLLQLRKVPISKQICIKFDKRLFSEKSHNQLQSFIGEACAVMDIKQDEMDALTVKLQEILLGDRAVFDKAHNAFVSFIEAYNNHECKYIFRMSMLNCGQIANAMGLLYLPKLRRIKMNGTESFVKRAHVDFNSIRFKNKWKERERKKKLKMIEQNKVEREKRKQRREQRMDSLDAKKDRGNVINGNQKKKKQRKKKRKGSFDDKNTAKKQKRMSHKLREFKHYQREEVLLKQLKKNHISQQEFDKQMGYQM
eukprot:712385_1